METKDSINAVQLLADQAADIREIPRAVDSYPFLVLNKNGSQQEVSLERFLEAPFRATGTISFYEIDSFIRYVNEHKVLGTVVFVTSATNFIAVFNHHAPGGAGWGDFKAILGLKKTPEWELWLTNSGNPKSQRDFAQFLEDNISDISSPPGADILEMVRFFEATQSAEFRSVVPENEHTSKLEFVRTETNKAGQKGSQELPREFYLTLKPFEGSLPTTIKAKLRYSINNQQLNLRYELVKAQKFIDDTCKQICEEIKKETEVDLFFGSPS